MSQYVEYLLDDGQSILIEIEEAGGVVRASKSKDEPISSKKKFGEALTNMRSSIKELVKELDELKVEEAEIKFGIKSTGEAGIFAIGKVGGEINYKITLKWKKSS